MTIPPIRIPTLGRRVAIVVALAALPAWAGLSSGPAREADAAVEVPESAPSIGATEAVTPPFYVSSIPFGSTLNDPNAQIAVSICGENLQGLSVTSSRGIVADGAAENCDGMWGGPGVAYFVNWNEANSNELLHGANDVRIQACNQYYECIDETAYIFYAPPSPDPVQLEAPAEQLTTTLGDSVVVKFVVRNNGSTSLTYDTVATKCYGGLGSCTKLTSTVVAAVGKGTSPDTVKVRVRGDSLGSKPVSATICRSTPSLVCVFGSQTVAVVPPTPVAANLVVTPTLATVAKGNGTSFNVTFTVQNLGSSSAVVALDRACDASVVTPASCSAPTQTTLAAGASTLITVGSLTAVSSDTLVTGAVSLTARHGAATVTAHTGVTVGPNGGAGGTAGILVSTANLNPESSVSRDQCLMYAAGDAAGVECGSLRLAHSLAPIQTMGRTRAPRLVYLSQHARPVYFVSANVTTRHATPDTVMMTLTIPGKSPVVRKYYWSSSCRNVECRVSIPVDAEALSLATGYYTYSLEARINGTSTTATTSGELAIVNRAKSPYGRGWWIEGLEQIIHVNDSTKFWVGGDGSTRLYKRIVDSVYTVAHLVSRPDTLRLHSGTHNWRRRLPNGAYVRFNSSGHHTHTVNAQGHVTRFLPTTLGGVSRVDSITVPVESSTISVAYWFRYDSTTRILSSTTLKRSDIPDSVTRVTQFGHVQNDSLLNTITDPDGTSIAFSYDAATGRALKRLNRKGDSTTYAYDAHGAVTTTTVAVPGDSAIQVRFCHAATSGLVSCGWGPSTPLGGVPVASALTRVDGPRGGLIDVSTFHLNRFGGPDSVQNPLGGRTRIERHWKFPALVTRIVDPMGIEQRAWYDTTRGLATQVQAAGLTASDSSARTKITWHSKWTLPTQIVPPLGDTTRIGYDGSYAKVLWRRLGPHDSLKVTFTYDAKHRVASVASPGSPTETYDYDATLGNIAEVETPPMTTTVTRNVWGEDTVSFDGFARTTSYRSVLGRVDSTRTVSVPSSYSLLYSSLSGSADSARRMIHTFYDLEGNVDSIVRRGRTSAGVLTTVAKTAWTYDAARRVKTKREDGMGPDTFTYDPAGLVTRHRTSRGHIVRSYYDAGGQLVARVTPAVTSPKQDCMSLCFLGVFPDSAWSTFPYFPTNLLGGGTSPDIVLPGDVETFSYDLAGRMLTANNRDARISRGYYANGALKADTLRIRQYAPSDTLTSAYSQHWLGLTFEVDILGRRTKRTMNTGSTQLYQYHPMLGVLERTIESNGATGGDTVTFSWDAAGRLRSQKVAGLVADQYFYGSLGRLDSSSIAGVYYNHYEYDARGKQTVRRTSGLAPEDADTSRMHYDGFGALIAREQYRPYGGWNIYSDEYSLDPLGNMMSHDSNRGWSTYRSRRDYLYSFERLASSATDPLSAERQPNQQPAVTSLDNSTYYYDQAGNTTRQGSVMQTVTFTGSFDYVTPTFEGGSQSRHFYDSSNRLRQVERWFGQQSGRHTIQEYRYDALGRRVLVRTRKDSVTTCSGTVPATAAVCVQAIERFYWDGDQLLLERRRAGNWAMSADSLDAVAGGSGAFFGEVRYVHALGIDDPLIVRKSGHSAFSPIRSGRGGYEMGRYLNNTAMTAYHWPGKQEGAYPGGEVRYPDVVDLGWFGSLLDNKRDASGMIYMRNRYYDPASGRFTQRDPIGLAGGVNQYGYVGGDPVNFSDPFGLCPECENDSQADGYKECPAASDNQADGAKECSAENKGDYHEQAAKQGIEAQHIHGLIAAAAAVAVVKVTGVFAALRAGAHALNARRAGTAIQGVAEGVKASAPPGPISLPPSTLDPVRLGGQAAGIGAVVAVKQWLGLP